MMKTSVSTCILFFFALLTSSTCFSQSNFTSKLIGIGVVVSDMERSMDFYTKGIGMVKTGNFTIKKNLHRLSMSQSATPSGKSPD